MNNKQITYIFMLSLWMGLTGYANGQTQPRTLTLQQAIEYALENNTKTRKAKLDEEESRYKIKEVRSQALPQITASGMLDNNLNIPVQLLPGELLGQPGTKVKVQFGQKYNVSGSAEVNQKLFDQSVIGALKAADASNQYYALNTARTKDEIIFQITSDYYQTLIIEENLAILKSNQEKMKKLIEMAEYQHRAGVIKTVDLNRLNVNLTNGQTQIQNTESDLETQLNTMKYHMGMSIHQPIELDGSSDVLNETIINSSMDNISEGRYDYQIVKQQQLLNSLEIKNLRAGRIPTISAYARQTYNAQRNEFNFFDGSQPWFPATAVGLKLNIPIFDGFKKINQVQQSKIRLLKLDQDEADVIRSIDLEYQNALSQLKNGLLSMEAQRANVTLAEEVYSITEDSYKQGITPLSDLLSSETELLEANNNFNESLLRYKLAQLQILKAKGQLSTILN